MSGIVSLAVVRRDGDDMPAHPAAEIFPPMTAAEFDALVDDMRLNGQREPIVVLDGRILDGRHRYRACRQAGIVPRFVQWDEQGTAEMFVISTNLHRRHLNESQRAMIGARMATLKAGRPEGGKSNVQIRTVTTQPESAAMLNIGRTSIIQARKVLAEGTPEQIAAVEGGHASVHVVADQIRGKVKQPKRRKRKQDESLAQVGGNPQRIQRLKLNAEVWANIGGALDALTALPLPADVAEIVVRHPRRRQYAGEKIARALQWLGEFAKAYDAMMDERSSADASDRD